MKNLLLALAIVLTFSNQALADIIITANGSHYGKITEIDNRTISMREGCGNSIYTTFWDTRTIILFNDQCSPPAVEASTSPVTADFKCDKGSFYIFSFNNVRSTFYCTSILFDGSDFKFQLYNGRKFIYKNFVSVRDIVSISFESVCNDFVKPPAIIPDSVEEN